MQMENRYAKGSRSMSTSFGRQQGMSLIGLIIGAIFIGFIALVVMKTVPLYIADQKLTTIFQNLEEESASSPAEIRKTVDKQLYINEVDDHFDEKDFDIRPVSGGYQVTYNYDGRAKLFANLSIVAEFRHQVRVSN
ncbi:MAG: DUF4845 domain-containing protein [Pseudomonadota bacterium]